MTLKPCTSCGALIEFVKLDSGKWIPVEGEYKSVLDAKDGEVLITDHGVRIPVCGFTRMTKAGARGRITHFATCQNAARHRPA